MLWITIITIIATIVTITTVIATITAIQTIIIAVISLLILSTHIIISRIMEIRTIHRTTVQHPRQADMDPHRVLFMEVRTAIMAPVMEIPRITARVPITEVPRIIVRVPVMEVPGITARALDMERTRITVRVPAMEVPGITARVMAMETRKVTMEPMATIPVIRVMAQTEMLMAAIQNQRRKRKKENRVDLENSLQNVQRLHLYSDWLQAVS